MTLVTSLVSHEKSGRACPAIAWEPADLGAATPVDLKCRQHCLA
jgi:hypothetical protein